MSGATTPKETRFEGAGVSPGIALGKVHVVRDEFDEVVRYPIASSQVPDEIGRFETALIQTRMQILEMQQRIAESIGAKDAAIFDAHLLVVEDRTLIFAMWNGFSRKSQLATPRRSIKSMILTCGSARSTSRT